MSQPEDPGRAPLPEDLKARIRKMTVEGTPSPAGGVVVIDEANVVPPADLVRAHEPAAEREAEEVEVANMYATAQELTRWMTAWSRNFVGDIPMKIRATLEAAGVPQTGTLSEQDVERIRQYIALQRKQQKTLTVDQWLVLAAVNAVRGTREPPWEWTGKSIQFEKGPPGTNFGVRPVVRFEVDTEDGGLEQKEPDK